MCDNDHAKLWKGRNMRIFTSCWSGYTGPGRIGICQGRPRGAPAGYRMYKALAPTWDIIKTSAGIDDYRPRFFAEILAPLDPQQVLADLRRLAGDHPPVRLCFEKLPLTRTNFCHRTMVATWITRETGVPVLEWSGAPDSNRRQAKLDV